MMKAVPYTREAYQLMHDGAIALSRVESNGMRVDVEYLEETIHRTRRKIKHLQRNLEGTKEVGEWRRRFGRKFNLDSNEQLGVVLYDVLGYKCERRTESGNYATDEETLGSLEIPFVQDYLRIKKLSKALSTNLVGLKREVVDGFVHPFFNLHTVTTYRSSSDSFNFQNIPIRNAVLAKLIRSAFIPRKGRRIVEVDYSGIEVRVAACYHKDPAMIKYIEDPTKDLHKEMAMQCFKLSEQDIGDIHVRPGKMLRHCGKNLFVFPQFYGDWYIDCARGMWDAIQKMQLKTATGRGLKEHLASQGIKRLGDLNPKEDPGPGTFEEHIRKVEQHFWNVRFPVYTKWKKSWYEAYRKTGFFQMKTGFVCQGYMKRNEVINYPVQGAAFHCLLRSLIQLVLKHLERQHMKTLVIGQIHDSLVADVPVEEMADFASLAHHVMETLLVRAWDWICVPIAVEIEAAPPGRSWAEKEEYKG